MACDIFNSLPEGNLFGGFLRRKKSCEGIFEGDLIIKDSEKKNGSTVCTHLVGFLVVFNYWMKSHRKL